MYNRNSSLKSQKQASRKIPASDNNRFKDKNEISYKMKQHNNYSDKAIFPTTSVIHGHLDVERTAPKPKYSRLYFLQEQALSCCTHRNRNLMLMSNNAYANAEGKVYSKS